MEKESQPASVGSFFRESQKVFFRQKREELGKIFGPRTFNLESQESGVYLSYERCQCERSFFAGFLFRSSFYWSKSFLWAWMYLPGQFFLLGGYPTEFQSREKRRNREKIRILNFYFDLLDLSKKYDFLFLPDSAIALSFFYSTFFAKKKKKIFLYHFSSCCQST